jgi:hypothetical protein
MEREFKNDYVTFNSLGPSPFHADFAVSQGDASEASQFTINDVTEGYPGYKQSQVKFLKRLLKCDVAEAFASYAGPFLSAYYAFVRYSLNLMFLSRESGRSSACLRGGILG